MALKHQYVPAEEKFHGADDLSRVKPTVLHRAGGTRVAPSRRVVVRAAAGVMVLALCGITFTGLLGGTGSEVDETEPVEFSATESLSPADASRNGWPAGSVDLIGNGTMLCHIVADQAPRVAIKGIPVPDAECLVPENGAEINPRIYVWNSWPDEDVPITFVESGLEATVEGSEVLVHLDGPSALYVWHHSPQSPVKAYEFVGANDDERMASLASLGVIKP